MLKVKDDVVQGPTKSIEHLFKQNKVDYIKGTASFVSPNTISVQLNEGGESSVEAKNVIIATGSGVTPFPGAIEIDGEQFVRSTGAPEATMKDGRYRWWHYWTGDGQRVESSGL
jgi:dihydrolipoamide dehydrogenase